MTPVAARLERAVPRARGRHAAAGQRAHCATVLARVALGFRGARSYARALYRCGRGPCRGACRSAPVGLDRPLPRSIGVVYLAAPCGALRREPLCVRRRFISRLVAALLAAGGRSRAAIVFLVTVPPPTPEFIALQRVFGTRVVLLYVGGLIGLSLIAGTLVNYWLVGYRPLMDPWPVLDWRISPRGSRR